ncbi:hypothetical protein BMA721280_I0458 [Burkholderia mallei 2002721280]|nr:hypothetical protein BMA721280_I0458 [Burkholderia mallei 2002721280]
MFSELAPVDGEPIGRGLFVQFVRLRGRAPAARVVRCDAHGGPGSRPRGRPRAAPRSSFGTL